MRHRFVNHARNVWDRAVSLLPRVDQLWYKYIHMEEMLGNVAGARQVFERWMRFEPDHMGWMAYVRVGAGTAVGGRMAGMGGRVAKQGCHSVARTTWAGWRTCGWVQERLMEMRLRGH